MEHAEFVLPAIDGYPLAANLFEPSGPARGTMILHAATATPQRFYRAFASFLADNGVRVVTYDYRGVGRSRPPSLRGYHATITEWAHLDARAAHRHVREHWRASPVALVGHSFGGQLVGLIDEAREIAGAIFVGAQSGYYGHWPLLPRARLGLTWRVLMPALTATLGYLPGQAGLGEDLPRGVAEEWGRWCLHPDYLVSGHPDATARFARFDRPTAFYSFTDDALGPPRAIRAMLGLLTSAKLEHRRVAPSDVSQRLIGHHGFFRPKCREPLWMDALAFLTDLFEGRTPQQVRRHASSRPSLAAWNLRDEDVLADLRAFRSCGE